MKFVKILQKLQNGTLEDLNLKMYKLNVRMLQKV